MAFGKVLIIGYGSVGQALTPLLLQHFGLASHQVSAIAADDDGRAVASAYGIQYENRPLHPGNYATELAARVGAGDVILNLSVHVSSLALIEWARDHGVLYLDTCIEPWEGGYAECGVASSNYALRHAALKLWQPRAPTAIVAHGANPGLISHFVKEGLIKLADKCDIAINVGESFANVAKALSVRVIQIAERDTQHTDAVPAPAAEFASTWSVDGLLAEAWQFGEFGWGTHERALPADGEHLAFGDGTSVLVRRHSATIEVKSWVPHVGEQLAYAITHHEAHSIASMLAVPASGQGGDADYRPTVYYAYRPGDATCAALDYWRRSGFKPPARKRILSEDLTGGLDQLGALFVFPGGAYWYGSTLTLAEARAIAPHNTATSLQVVAGILGALEWMRHNPVSGVVEAERMDHELVLRVARPYLGTIAGVLTDWQPAAAGALEFKDFEARHVPHREEVTA